MSAADNLSGDQFFHGTKAVIKDGVVRPANDADRSVSEYSMGDPGDMSEGDHAFAIRNDEHYAWHAAMHYSSGGGRPKVYEVEPAADMKPGPWNKDHPNFLEHHELDVDPDWLKRPVNREAWDKDVADAKSKHQDEWASQTGFKIKQRIDTAPGRQGTFPSINWNKTRPGFMRGGDVNHPSDDQVRYGQFGLGGAQAAALKDNAAIDKERNPDTRQGRSFREFMEGKPPPAHPTLF